MSDEKLFSQATSKWFDDTFNEPTPIQRHGWEAIKNGSHSLLIAPTGSGKTLAAFLTGIDYCLTLQPDAPVGVRVLYVSPLKALVYDVERNLRAPLIGVQHKATALELSMRDVKVDVRTGDTPHRQRQQQLKEPADILVTTPESLFLMLGSKARETLRSVHTVIVDEIHALAPTKRGVHLALSLERLALLCAHDPQRIGLSATVRPRDEVARFLGGERSVEVIDLSAKPLLDVTVSVPVPDMENATNSAETDRGGPILSELYTREVSTPPAERSIWSAIYPQLLQQIKQNRATIIFVNSRGLCERLTQRLNDLAQEEIVRSHHGSVSREKRAEIEEGLKQGQIRGIVATSSLELGIDMGAVDRVIMVESPGSVARGLQRAGRAGHHVGEISVGCIFPKFRGDLLESTVIAQRMLAGNIEAIRVPQNALDVLAQHLVAICCETERKFEQIAHLVSRAYPYHQLSTDMLRAVLDMLSGHYPSQAFADLKPLLAWDRTNDELRARRGAAMVSRMNAGTIPDRGNYTVTLGPEGTRVGELDEEMVFETRPGENILLGATTWRVEEITRDKVIVSPAPGEPGKLPFWRGEGPGRPIELGQALGAFVRKLGSLKYEHAMAWLHKNAQLDANAAANLATYIIEQKRHTGSLPTDRSITVERFRDELGDWRVCILTPFGARVHAPWAMALQQVLSTHSGFEVQVMYTDDGIVLRFADIDELPELKSLLPDPNDIDELVTDQLAHTALFAGLFRENAVRSLLLPRRRPEQRNPLWAQRLKSQNLLAAVRKYASFPIVLETYRQALSDLFDIAALRKLLLDIQSRQIRVDEVETGSASPFARSLVFAYVAAYIYEQDAPLAERKAQALTLDRNLLNELLGQAQLRELIDPEVMNELEVELQHLTAARRARDADELHDLLRRLGDLSEDEINARAHCTVAAALNQLAKEGRAVQVKIAGEWRWIAAENAAIYRDALGVMPPSGLPGAFLQPPDNPFEFLLHRYARTHGPFLTGDIAQRFGLQAAQVEPVLCALANTGILMQGEIRPGGIELDWCEIEVLRHLKRRTLARLRHAVAPVDGATLSLFLPQWHGLGSKREGLARLLEVLTQLEGLELSWSILHTSLLPARIAGFKLEMLDMLTATGQVVWVGRSPLGSKDGRIALYLREHVRELLVADEPLAPQEQMHSLIIEHLQTHGASFLFELESAVRQQLADTTSHAFEAALWDLVWAGCITNDTFAPLRSLGRRQSKSSRKRWRSGQSMAGGRWSLVSGLLDNNISDTQRSVARANMLLERYGIVCRETVLSEEIPGGFAPVYKVLSALEESGHVRRGYFIEGLSGAQFARPGIVDRLRGMRPEETTDIEVEAKEIIYLSVIDPANPWGSLLPWPETGSTASAVKPRRVAGAWLLLHTGKPLIYLAANGRQLITFPVNLAEPGLNNAAFAALHLIPKKTRRRSLIIEKIDGQPIRDSKHYESMLACGFVSDYRGLASEIVA